MPASLAQLEQRVAALEAATTGAETLSPNYLTLTPAGGVGANFTGKVQATELDLLAGPSPAPINWINAAGGVLAELSSDAAGNLTLASPTLTVESLAAAGISSTGTVSAGGVTAGAGGVTSSGGITAPTMAALFKGGIQVPETSGLYSAGAGIGWQNSTPGDGAAAIPENIVGANSGLGQHSIEAQCTPDANDSAQLALNAKAAGGAGSASITVAARDSAGNFSGTLNLIDSLRRSAFAQNANNLVELANHQSALVNLGLTWGVVQVGTGTVIDGGSGNWAVAGTATGAVQLQGSGVGPNYCLTLATVTGRLTGDYTVNATNGVNPVITVCKGTALSTENNWVNFMCFHW